MDFISAALSRSWEEEPSPDDAPTPQSLSTTPNDEEEPLTADAGIPADDGAALKGDSAAVDPASTPATKTDKGNLQPDTPDTEASGTLSNGDEPPNDDSLVAVTGKEEESTSQPAKKVEDQVTSEENKEGTPFEVKKYAVTDCGVQMLAILTCPITWVAVCPGVLGRKTLTLEEEEAYYEVHCCPFCHTTTRRPYGELGSVDKINCLGCSGVHSELFQGWCVAPGCGCSHQKVDEIVSELKSRMKERGDTGQIRRTEQAHEDIKCLRQEMNEMKADIKLIMRALNVQEATAPMERE